MKAFRPLIIKGKCSHQMKTNQMIDTGLKGLAESFEVQENLLWALLWKRFICLKALVPLRGGSLVTDTQLIDIGRMEG